MFKFKGISSKEMDVHVTEIDNLIRKAPQRYEEIYIDGRDGAFFHPLGYSPIEVPLELTLMKPERIDEVLQWLNGTGWLEYNGRKTKAHIFSEVEPVRASTVRIIQVTIIRNPFWEKVEDDWEEAWGANLIGNGWDDFKAYGSGKNYVENWNFEDNNLERWFPSYGEHGIRDNRYSKIITSDSSASRVEYSGTFPKGMYMFRIKIKSDKKIQVRGWSNVNTSFGSSITIDHPDFKVFESRVEIRDSEDVTRFRFYVEKNGSKGQQFDIEWIQLTPVDNQHLVVEKKPLGNGLTRIQTWGGSDTWNRKIGFTTSGNGNPHTYSLRIKNSGDDLWLIGGNLPSAREDISKEERYYKVTNFSNQIWLHVYSEGNLDFIASNPIIVEGDQVPNWQATSDPAIYNEGTAVSKPLIKLEKGKDRQCEFEVNGTYFKFHFNDDDHVILDCEEMEATYNGFNRNRHLTIGFEWPKLKPKENFVKRISGDAKISFKRKDRWL